MRFAGEGSVAVLLVHQLRDLRFVTAVAEVNFFLVAMPASSPGALSARGAG